MPSDGLTIDAIVDLAKALLPKAFKDDSIKDSMLRADFASMKIFEERYAEKAFATSLRYPDPWPNWSYNEIRETLAKWYVEFGLATTLEEAVSLTDSIPQRAVEQARQSAPSGTSQKSR